MEKTINEIKIDIPEGTEAYLENNIIKFRPIKKELTYDDIAKELFKDKKTYYTDAFCNIKFIKALNNDYNDTNNCTSEKQAKKLLAINQLMNVAKYLNGGWQPDWDNKNKIEYKYYLYIDYPGNKIEIAYVASCCSDGIYFKSKELAQQAIDILGEETIKLSLCTDW
jgi:hypothetical protein